MSYEIYDAERDPMADLIQELSRRRFVLGRETYHVENPWGYVFELRPLEPHIPGEFSRSLIEEEAPQIYEKPLIGKPSAK